MPRSLNVKHSVFGEMTESPLAPGCVCGCGCGRGCAGDSAWRRV